jgi:hypothetical protein
MKRNLQYTDPSYTDPSYRPLTYRYNGFLDIFLDEIYNIAVLGDIYNITDVNTVIKFHKYINFNKNYVDLVSCLGKVDTLDLLMRKFGSQLKYTENALDRASEYGQINVLNWWVKSNLPLKYTSNALIRASSNGYINVLNWWRESNLPLKYDKVIIFENACNNCSLDVLDWWYKSGLKNQSESEYSDSEIIINRVCGYSNYFDKGKILDLLEWWKNTVYPLQYSEYTLDNVKRIDVLEWWVKSNLPLKYTGRLLTNVSERQDIDMLEWWKNSGLPLKYNVHIINNMIFRFDMLKWWKNSGLPFNEYICVKKVNGKWALEDWH